ncbi:MAG: filamentous hemagglutinin family protein, partial [Gammaproteobacteria bacterium]
MLRSITPTMTFLNRSIAFALGLIVSSPLSANPQGLDVVSGTVGVTTPNGQTLEITNSPGAILNWQGFDIGVGEITRFIQQSASSLVLNRVVTQNSSEIFGQLSSNGGVFLINPAGILIGRDAQIDTASLVMSTLDIKDGDFTAGRYKFEGDSTSGTITNHGYIKSAPNGEIILIAPSIINAPQEGNEQSGLIESEGGDLILAAGFGITISSLDDPNVSFEVQAPENEVINLGRLLARGGTASVLAGTIKHSGEINADSLSVDELGRVVLIASSRIETSADSVISARGETLTNDEIDLAAVAPDADVLIRINPLGADGGEVIIRAAATPNTDEQAIITISDTQIELAGRIDVTGYTGGNTSIEADAVALSSIIDASGNNTGGTVHVLGDDVSLTAATITANSGIGAGGQIRIGGDYQGAEALRAAATTTVDATSQVQANAGEDGLGGTVIIWSDEETIFSGQAAARGGANSGDGGLVEVSGKETLRFSGAVDVGAPAGQGGTLLLDPQRIFIIPGGVSVSADNPSPFAGDGFGSSFQVLTNGNILVQNQNADISGAMDAGQITVLDSFGTVLGTLNGTTADQRLGAFGFLNLAGNLLIRDRNASNGAAAMAGALILLDPTTGQEIGRTLGGSAGEQFGANLLAFSGDNALFRSTSADISGIGADVGLVSLISGTTGLELGRITGQSANENFGTLFTSLGTTFVVRSPTADVAGNIDAGAVVLGNLTTGNEVGRVNGGAAGDMLGQTVDFFGTPSGSYLIRASLADTGGLTDNGTAILVSRTTGMELGRASGLADDDHLGSFAAISTGPNYFLRVPEADFGIMTDAGSLVLVNGATGARIGAADGGANNDFFSQNGIESLGANIAVVINELADTAGGIDSGSVVAVNLSTGAIAGRVDGTSANEMLGSDGIVTRSNGNYFIPSPLADTGGGSNVDGGSVILADGNTGNALAQFDGDTVGEQFGANRLDFSLANDDIIVFDPDHGSGAGIVTQLASSELSPGVIERGSVMGGGTGDGVGSTAPIFLAGGNYVVASPNMNAAAGSVSVIDDATAAPVFASIDGLNSGEQVGALLDFATFGFGDKFAIRAPNYNPGNGEGAIFFVNGADGGGIVRQLMGGLSDSIGAEALIAAPNGNIIVGNPNSNGAMGSVLLLDASASYATIATINGISSGERLGDSTIGSIDVFSRSAFGDFIINSPDRDAGGFAAAGGVILASTTDLGGGVILRGVISGAETQDRLGEDNTIQNLSNDDFIIFNANADDVGGSGGFDDQGAIILASAAGTELGRFYGQNFGEQLGLNGQVRETNSGNGNYYAVSDLASPGGVTDAGSVYLLDGTNGLLIGQADGDTANENFGSSFFDQFGLISSGSNDVRVFSSAGHSGGGTVVQLADVDLGGGNIIRGRVDGTVGLGNLENLGAFGSQITPDGMHYLLRSQNADAGGLVDAGTVYFVNISTGALTNQVDGISANENFGSFGNTSLSTFGGNIFATSESADVGPTMNAGHVMLLDSSGALIGDFFGNNTNEFLGSNFQFVGADIWTIAPQHNNGGQIAAGGIFAIANQDLGGANIVRNSLLGSRAGDNLGSL